jgi:hypothetical protein
MSDNEDIVSKYFDQDTINLLGEDKLYKILQDATPFRVKIINSDPVKLNFFKRYFDVILLDPKNFLAYLKDAPRGHESTTEKRFYLVRKNYNLFANNPHIIYDFLFVFDESQLSLFDYYISNSDQNLDSDTLDNIMYFCKRKMRFNNKDILDNIGSLSLFDLRLLNFINNKYNMSDQQVFDYFSNLKNKNPEMYDKLYKVHSLYSPLFEETYINLIDLEDLLNLNLSASNYVIVKKLLDIGVPLSKINELTNKLGIDKINFLLNYSSLLSNKNYILNDEIVNMIKEISFEELFSLKYEFSYLGSEYSILLLKLLHDNGIKGQAGFIGRFLPRDDPRVLFIGNYTDCCQKIGGQAEDVAIHSQTSPNAAVFIVEHNEEGIIAQSYTFNDNNKNVIFDNIEIDFRNSNLDYDYLLDIIINIYKNAANAIKSLGYENVFLGANNYDIDSDSYSRFNLEKAEKKYRDIKAPDYDGSYLLDSNDSKFKQCFQIKLTEELPIYQII